MITGLVRERIELTHEPGQWIEIRKPSFFMLLELDIKALLQQCVTGWSYYKGQPKPDDVIDLDMATCNVLAEHLRQLGNPPDTVKNSGAPSTEA